MLEVWTYNTNVQKYTQCWNLACESIYSHLPFLYDNNPTTGDVAEGSSSCQFMVTRVCKIHHRKGQSRIVLTAKKNMQIYATLCCPQTKAF